MERCTTIILLVRQISTKCTENVGVDLYELGTLEYRRRTTDVPDQITNHAIRVFKQV